jgi:hypothetical protein
VRDCLVVREELLDAAPDELAGVAATSLATHVRDCTRCGPLARMLLDEQSRLGSAVALVQPRLSAAMAADAVLSTARPVPYLQLVEERETRGERFMRFAAAVFPMAAAAGIAAWVVYGDRNPVPYAAPIVEAPASAVRITAPAGAQTVILTTSDPDITFAWIGKETAP